VPRRWAVDPFTHEATPAPSSKPRTEKEKEAERAERRKRARNWPQGETPYDAQLAYEALKREREANGLPPPKGERTETTHKEQQR
jgi:hypothetical protein